MKAPPPPLTLVSEVTCWEQLVTFTQRGRLCFLREGVLEAAWGWGHLCCGYWICGRARQCQGAGAGRGLELAPVVFLVVDGTPSRL